MGGSNPPPRLRYRCKANCCTDAYGSNDKLNYIAVQNLVKTLQSDSSMSNRKSVGRVGGASVSEWWFRVQF